MTTGRHLTRVATWFCFAAHRDRLRFSGLAIIWLRNCTPSAHIMVQLRYVSASILLAMSLVGCSKSSFAPTSPSSGNGSSSLLAAELSGTWTLTSIRPAGGVEQPAPAGAAYTLTFADSRLSTRVDCNACVGAFTLSGQTITAGPALACTKAACPTMAFESVYTRLLSGESTVTVSGGALVLSSTRGVLRFTRA